MSTAFMSTRDTIVPDGLGIAWVGALSALISAPLWDAIVEHSAAPGTESHLAFFATLMALNLWVAHRTTRGADYHSIIVSSLTGSALVGILMPPVIWCLAPEFSVGSTLASTNLFRTLIFGGIVGAPIGLLFGAVCATGLSLLRWLQETRSFSARDFSLMGLGLSLALLGFWSATLSANRSGFWVQMPIVLAGQLAASRGIHRSLLRWRFKIQVGRGKAANWKIIPDRGKASTASVPRLFPFGAHRSLLVHRSPRKGGPFRGVGMTKPVALV